MSYTQQKENERIAIVSADKCKPKKCQLECKKNCPVVRMGKMCIEVSFFYQKAVISETQCIGCGICVKKCPFDAIQIINMPKRNDVQTAHRYGVNSFQLINIPCPKINCILGIIGSNGTGKSTALKILAGEIKPNLGNFREPSDLKNIKDFFKKCGLQNYFNFLNKNKFKIHIKPQFVDALDNFDKTSTVESLLKVNECPNQEILEALCLSDILKKKINELSGGELQRFTIGFTLIQKGEVFLFDEISSYLDIKQRLTVSKAIRKFVSTCDSIYLTVVEHDLAIVDYLSDFICCFYGISGVYGIVTPSFPTKEGLNIFISGFIPNKNIRFRDTSIKFIDKIQVKKYTRQIDCLKNFYPKSTKTFNFFKLEIDSGYYLDSEIIVLLGENGVGKTSFIKIIGNMIKPDDYLENHTHNTISYKPQKIFLNSKERVDILVSQKFGNSVFKSSSEENIFNLLQINSFLKKKIEHLSGGELQRLCLLFCLEKNSNLYLIDEPSSYLDSEQRLIVAKLLKNFFVNKKKTGFVIEHDFIMATYLADRVIVFEGLPSVFCKANPPSSVSEGINTFLKQLDITFRRDSVTSRPRINKLNSIKDREQKAIGKYYFDT